MISIGNLFSPSIISINVYLNRPFKVDQKGFHRYDSLNADNLEWFYRDEQGVNVTTYGADCPRYSEVLSFFEHSALDKKKYADVKDVIVTVEEEAPYHLADGEFADLYDKAKAAFKSEGRKITKENRSLIRLNGVKHANGQTELFIQQTDYNTQFVTNLVMNMKHADGKSWRVKISEEHGFKLPPLENPPLANSLGVGLILVTGNGQTILPLRSELAVAGKMWGCTCGFAAAWKEEFDKKSFPFEEFLDLIVPDHLWLELAIQGNVQYAPLVLCREWLRGGKPELLLVGKTDLSLSQIRANIEKAEHKEEITKRWGRRVFMTKKNADEHPLSPGLMINSEYLRKYVQTQQGKGFFGEVIEFKGI